MARFARMMSSESVNRRHPLAGPSREVQLFAPGYRVPQTGTEFEVLHDLSAHGWVVYSVTESTIAIDGSYVNRTTTWHLRQEEPAAQHG